MVLGLLLAGAAAAGWMARRETAGRTIPSGITGAEYDDARSEWHAQGRPEPTHAETLLALARTALSEGFSDKAIAALQGIPTEDPALGLAARAEEGRLLLQQNRAVEAERALSTFLESAQARSSIFASEQAAAYNQLVYLLSVELRLEDRKPWLEEMHRLGIADVYDSKMLFFPQLLLWHPTSGRARLSEFRKHDPEELQMQVAQARYEFLGGDGQRALARISELRSRHPGDLRVAAALGEALFENDDWKALDELLRSVPPMADSDPWSLTFLRGQHALHHRQWAEALRSFQHGLRQDPASSALVAGECKALEGLQEREKLAAALERALELSRIRIRLVQVNERDPDASEALAEACRRIQFDEAARVFHAHALRIRSEPRRSPQPTPPGERDEP